MTAGRLECFLDRSEGCVGRVRFDPELLTAVGLVSAHLAPDALVGEASDRTLREGAATADDESWITALDRAQCTRAPICSPEWTLGAAAFPTARTISVPDAPVASEEFAEALREFCSAVQPADP